MRLSVERLSAEVLDHIKKWYAKCEEADCMPENGLTIGRLLDTIEALQQENEQLRAQVQKLNATINRAAEFLGENRGCPPDCDKIDCDSFESCQHCWSSWLMGGMDDAGIS
jgi:hypothetical protein